MSRTLCTECVTVTHPRAWEGLENRLCTLCNNSTGPRKQMGLENRQQILNGYSSVQSVGMVALFRSIHGNPGYAPVLLLHYLQYCADASTIPLLKSVVCLAIHHIDPDTMCNQYAGYPPDVAPNTSPNEVCLAVTEIHPCYPPPPTLILFAVDLLTTCTYHPQILCKKLDVNITIDEYTKKSSFMDDTYSQKLQREPEPMGTKFNVRKEQSKKLARVGLARAGKLQAPA
ncbi:hypothetical protein C8Q80DRAFT_1124620 [Daedaleopsis nitida]|nr:hypothetical protein C8Q80DRAFT_1124620 [Daedaleopsis nitida]